MTLFSSFAQSSKKKDKGSTIPGKGKCDVKPAGKAKSAVPLQQQQEDRNASNWTDVAGVPSISSIERRASGPSTSSPNSQSSGVNSTDTSPANSASSSRSSSVSSSSSLQVVPGQFSLVSAAANRALLAAAAAEGVMPQINRYGRVIPYTQEMDDATMPCLAYATARPTVASEDYGAPPPYLGGGQKPSRKR